MAKAAKLKGKKTVVIMTVTTLKSLKRAQSGRQNITSNWECTSSFCIKIIRRPDLLVDYKFLVEVKGLNSSNPGQVSKQIKHANSQIEAEHSKYPEDKRLPAKIVLISLHTDLEVGFRAISEGYKEARRKNQVHFKTELWIGGEIHILGEDE